MDKLDKLEKRIDGVERKLDLLANNHLAHMSKDLKSIIAALRLGSVLLTVGLLVVLATFWSL
jgi:hypothetical protein